MASPLGNMHEYTVSELSGAVKSTIEDNFSLVRVRGELGRVSRPGSGHLYLDLKDDKAVLNGVIWKGVAGRLKIQPEQGMEVIATGRMTTFAGQSRYQLVIDSLEPAGVGALMALFEERKKKLASEGLFDPARKKPLPYLPEVIGVVTSPSGAVIRDILHRLRDRFPRRVIVWPTLVQGRGAEAKIAEAINGFNALPEGGSVPRPDLLIVARGGGSLEDLWCFNEEVVARAAAESQIPLISAVGHETDTTLIDFVADKRAPTPTAAAEIAVPMRSELVNEILNKRRRMLAALSILLERRRTELRSAVRGLGRPEDILGLSAQRLDRASEQLKNGLRACREVAAGKLAAARLQPVLLRRYHGEESRKLTQLWGRLYSALGMRIATARQSLAARRLTAPAMARKAQLSRQTYNTLAVRWEKAVVSDQQRRVDQVRLAHKLLESYSHQNVLDRGFALVRDTSGTLIKSTQQAIAAGQASVQFADGAVGVEVKGTPPDMPPTPKKKTPNTPSKPRSPSNKQASLFDE